MDPAGASWRRTGPGSDSRPVTAPCPHSSRSRTFPDGPDDPGTEPSVQTAPPDRHRLRAREDLVWT